MVFSYYHLISRHVCQSEPLKVFDHDQCFISLKVRVTLFTPTGPQCTALSQKFTRIALDRGTVPPLIVYFIPFLQDRLTICRGIINLKKI